MRNDVDQCPHSSKLWRNAIYATLGDMTHAACNDELRLALSVPYKRPNAEPTSVGCGPNRKAREAVAIACPKVVRRRPLCGEAPAMSRLPVQRCVHGWSPHPRLAIGVTCEL